MNQSGESQENQPTLNNITAPFLYMFNNNYIRDKDDTVLTTEEIIKKFNRIRLNSISKNIDLFSNENIIQFPTDTLFKNINEDGVAKGQLYSIEITDYIDKIIDVAAEKYDHMLFVDITRNGMRLVVPIYKLFSYVDNTLIFNILNITGLIPEIDLQSGDKFLVIAGDTLKVSMRNLKKNSRLKNRAQLEHAGVTSKFSIDQI